MNILYLVKSCSVVEPLGPMQISAVTKQLGHTSFFGELDKDDVLRLISDNSIDVVAFSMLSTDVKAFRATAESVKARYPDMPIIAGGPHPTYFPNMVKSWPLDAVIVGEGDLAIGPLLDAIQEGASLSSLPNVHTRDGHGEVLPLVGNLDDVPFPDRELIANVEPLSHIPMKSFMATRGCPYSCAYCYNNAYKDLYKGLGKLYRRRSVENLITELETVTEKYSLEFLRFGDDVFIPAYDEWLEEFVEKYKTRVGKPFYCLIRPNIVENNIVAALKDAGCHSVAISLESANQQLRKTVLNRSIDNETMFKAYGILHDHDIKIFSNAMLGLPQSTLKDDLDSLKMTFDLNPTYASFTVFTPFPGTALHSLCVDEGYIVEPFNEEEFPESTFQGSSLNTVDAKGKEVHQNILMLGALANAIPALRNIIFEKLIYWKPNKGFELIGFFVRNYLQRKVWPFSLGAIQLIKVAWKVFWGDMKNYRKKI